MQLSGPSGQAGALMEKHEPFLGPSEQRQEFEMRRDTEKRTARPLTAQRAQKRGPWPRGKRTLQGTEQSQREGVTLHQAAPINNHQSVNRITNTL